jgi:hypothetical protein
MARTPKVYTESLAAYEKKVRGSRVKMLAAEKKLAREITSKHYLDAAKAGGSIPWSVIHAHQQWNNAVSNYMRTVAQTF